VAHGHHFAVVKGGVGVLASVITQQPGFQARQSTSTQYYFWVFEYRHHNRIFSQWLVRRWYFPSRQVSQSIRFVLQQDATEAEMRQQFWTGPERYKPELFNDHRI